MNILLVAQNYHPFVGGVETHARQLAHARTPLRYPGGSRATHY